MTEEEARAWTAVYRRYGEAVYRRASRLLREDAAAKDATQETFLRAWRYRDSYRGDSMLSWLFTIADRVCFDAMQRRAKHEPSEDLSEDLARLEEPLPSIDARLVRDARLRRMLAHADDETRAILIARYIDELDMAAISARLRRSERTIRRRLQEFFTHARAADVSGSHPRVQR